MPKGSSQPPRKIVMTIALTISRLRYSANRNATMRVPPYSVM